MFSILRDDDSREIEVAPIQETAPMISLPPVKSTRPTAWQRPRPVPLTGMYDRPIPPRWPSCGNNQDDGHHWISRWDDRGRSCFLAAAHHALPAMPSSLAAKVQTPDESDHPAETLAYLTVLLTSMYLPEMMTPRRWMMDVRAWRDDHMGLVDSADPPPPWRDERRYDTAAICASMIMLHASAMLLGDARDTEVLA